MTFFQEVFRLNLLEAHVLEQFWSILLSQSPPPATKMELYYKQIFVTARKYDQWEQLSEESKKHFENLMNASSPAQDEVLEVNSEASLPIDPYELFLSEIHKNLQNDHIEDTQELLFLFQQTISNSKGENWENRHLLTSIVKTISLSKNYPLEHEHELKNTTALFLGKNCHQPFDDVVKFLFACSKIINNASPIFTELALEIAYAQNLLDNLSDTSHKELCSHLVPHSNHIPINNPYLLPWMLELKRRNLWQELLSISSLMMRQQFQLNILVETYLWCCSTALSQEHQEDRDRAEKLLAFLIDRQPPKDLEKEHFLIFSELCQKCVSHHQRTGNKMSALVWLDKLLHFEPQNDHLYGVAFDLLKSIAAKGQMRSTYTLIDKLNSKGNEERWIDLFECLIGLNDINAALYLLQSKRSSLGLNASSYKHLWQGQLDQIIVLISNLATATDNTTRTQRDSLHELLNDLIWHCRPDNHEVWRQYLHVLVGSAPTPLVEGAFLRLLKNKNKPISSYLNSNRTIQYKNPQWEILPVESLFWKGTTTVFTSIASHIRQATNPFYDEICSLISGENEKRLGE